MTDQALCAETDRPTWPAILTGFRGRCPNCGEGRLLHSYLKVNDHCSECGEEYMHHRADDGPAYLTILLVGHLMAPLLLVVFETWRPSPMTLFTIFALGCLSLSLYLLPRLKGMVVAYQWARRMHGFDKNR
ncbi:DUF983 domain-containing protein [Ruegeria pomeroyi]|uniref:DUF983 domain-containing protein n=2 Tax=Ruegeria TaxID=97050 RepID=A0A9Q3WF66_9RHOB|nr:MULTISPECIES: DUF983 domain-containing protein [Ruegeria]MCE8507545.1 DUF983 domain-containing protein [Ruegeria pomeroyi]MCE8512689.1 DUF983 domain-containing protein [Ruegeria pomeroyi]MCE8516541.1 DUF983 domain-containing protein [Ruegeria pomeroyi]MCE8521386.1 DUF983 domain-containing protein [Ruegeria pomeroyi]MCE8526141.1 DUF983 domain-containing protein [Ruegeria pomeroyi]